MFTAQLVREIRQLHPDEIRRRGTDPVTFIWSPTGGLFVGWPMDHDPTHPGHTLPHGQQFRPNHAEMMMIDPQFTAKFFGGRDDLLTILREEPWKQRELVDQHGLSGRVGRVSIPAIGGPEYTVVGFWPSPNVEQYLHRAVGDCQKAFDLAPQDIVYVYKQEPMTVDEVLKRAEG